MCVRTTMHKLYLAVSVCLSLSLSLFLSPLPTHTDAEAARESVSVTVAETHVNIYFHISTSVIISFMKIVLNIVKKFESFQLQQMLSQELMELNS